jgi:hypothetical protein
MRVLILGLQGADPALLTRDDDRLPTLRALRGLGPSGVVHPDPATGPEGAWATLVAGRPAGGCELGRGEAPPPPLLWDALGEEAGPAEPVLVGLPLERPPEPEPGVGGGEVARAIERARGRFAALRGSIAGRPWAVAMLLEAAPPPTPGAAGEGGPDADAWAAALDEELGRTLEEAMATETDLCVLLVAWPNSPSREQPTGAGAFLLASSAGLPAGAIEGARLVDLAPTILALAGRAAPDEMHGRPLQPARFMPDPFDDEQAVRLRLQGLGYLA